MTCSPPSNGPCLEAFAPLVMAPVAAIASVILPRVMALSVISSFFRLETSFLAFAILSFFATLYSRELFAILSLFAALYRRWYSLTLSLFRSL